MYWCYLGARHFLANQCFFLLAVAVPLSTMMPLASGGWPQPFLWVSGGPSCKCATCRLTAVEILQGLGPTSGLVLPPSSFEATARPSAKGLTKHSSLNLSTVQSTPLPSEDSCFLFNCKSRPFFQWQRRSSRSSILFENTAIEPSQTMLASFAVIAEAFPNFWWFGRILWFCCCFMCTASASLEPPSSSNVLLCAYNFAAHLLLQRCSSYLLSPKWFLTAKMWQHGKNIAFLNPRVHSVADVEFDLLLLETCATVYSSDSTVTSFDRWSCCQYAWKRVVLEDCSGKHELHHWCSAHASSTE